MNKIIFFELNEVPIRILDFYIDRRPNSWIAKNFSKFRKYETYSENEGRLSPWNTWPTLHRGVPSSKHFIADFNQDMTAVDREFPTVWNILAKNKVRTGVFGSLHSYPMPKSLEGFDFYVPDVFAASPEAHPKNVEIFQKINLSLSRKSARNVDSSFPLKEGVKLLTSIGDLGFQFSTLKSIGSQLVEERLESWKVVRRRTYQTVLSFDIFYKQLKQKKPDFVTFFTNHVASSMHRYWAASFPDEYENLGYDEEWIDTYGNEIIFTMDWTDKMLAKLGKFVDRNPDYKLVFTSSMGQEAVECEPIETELCVTDPAELMTTLGIKEGEYRTMPAMVPQFNFFVDQREEFIDALQNFTINGEKVTFREKESGFFSIDLGHRNLKQLDIQLRGQAVPFDKSGLENTVIQDKSTSTAYHIPEGHLYSYHPTHQVMDSPSSQLPTCDILPILLNNFGVKKERYMNQTEYADL